MRECASLQTPRIFLAFWLPTYGRWLLKSSTYGRSAKTQGFVQRYILLDVTDLLTTGIIGNDRLIKKNIIFGNMNRARCSKF